MLSCVMCTSSFVCLCIHLLDLWFLFALVRLSLWLFGWLGRWRRLLFDHPENVRSVVCLFLHLCFCFRKALVLLVAIQLVEFICSYICLLIPGIVVWMV